MSSETRRIRRCVQFRLRTLLLLMVPAALIFGWIGSRMEQTRKYERILAELNEYRPGVSWEGGKPTLLSFNSPVENFALRNEDLVHVGKIDSLRELLFFHAPNITDEGLEHLKDLKGLAVLRLSHTGITDAGLADLQDFPELRTLILDGTAVTDSGLRQLESIPELSVLLLRGTAVSDTGINHLSALPKLCRLDLTATRVTDAGLPLLRELPRIKHIGLGPVNSNLTDRGLDELMGSMPEVKLHVVSGGDELPEEGTWLDGTRDVVVARVTEGCVAMAMLCRFPKGRLERTDLEVDDFRAGGQFILEALAPQLPDQAVELLRKGLIQPETHRDVSRTKRVRELLAEGMDICVRFGVRSGYAHGVVFHVGGRR